jgi:hypothetical protein
MARSKISEQVERLTKQGMAYQGAQADLTDVLRWARTRASTEEGVTHWEDCWRIHLPCAVAEVERLRRVSVARAEMLGVGAQRLTESLHSLANLAKRMREQP